jgi:hypothetical protein
MDIGRKEFEEWVIVSNPNILFYNKWKKGEHNRGKRIYAPQLLNLYSLNASLYVAKTRSRANLCSTMGVG